LFLWRAWRWAPATGFCVGGSIRYCDRMGGGIVSEEHPERAGRYAYLISLLLFVGFLALRLPFRAQFLVNWDAVNFALGTQFFSLQHHQPHPPGYIGYVALGWVFNHVTGDANSSLTWMSVISGSAAPAGFFLLALLFMRWRYALVTAVLFGLSPVVWYYSEVALTYSVELGLAVFFLRSSYQARRRLSFRHLVLATALLVLLGALRPSGGLFLMPMWLYVAWSFPWRQRLQGGAFLVLGNLAWLVPLLWLSGGIVPYLRASSELVHLVVVPTSVFALNPLGMGQNIGFVLLGVVVGANLGLLIVVAACLLRVNPFAFISRHRIFFLLWLVPALLTYLLLHTGQLGYVLFILPTVFLVIGSALAGIGARRPRIALSGAAAAAGSVLARRHALAVVVAALALSNAITFLFAPNAVYAIARANDPAVANDPKVEPPDSLRSSRIANHQEAPDVAEYARQYNVRLNDTHWSNLIEFVKEYDPETTVVLAAPEVAGTFRHLSYYLPDYRVYGLREDLNGSFGHLFTAFGGTSDYAVEGLEDARERLDLPVEVRWLVIADRDIYRRVQGVPMDSAAGETPGVALPVPRGTSLLFHNTDEGNAKIILRQDAQLEADGVPP
jgi:hypothetical protein